MLKLLMLKLLLTLFKSKTQLQIEIIFLRKQLEILNRNSKKVQVTRWDKLFFSTIISFFNNWEESLIIIKPETIIRWHRKKFYQHLLGKRKLDIGRPRVSREIIELIKRIANENPMWGVARIHGEILNLVIKYLKQLFGDIHLKTEITVLDSVGKPF
jgi:hypothetical protein